jgi:hypothetical protein
MNVFQLWIIEIGNTKIEPIVTLDNESAVFGEKNAKTKESFFEKKIRPVEKKLHHLHFTE